MSVDRLVEYFVVAGVDRGKKARRGLSPVSPPTSPNPQDTEPKQDLRMEGTIIQRYPTVDRQEAALPAGIEIFCQPLGWYLTHIPASPSFVDFILTAEDGSRLYCTSLNFHTLYKENSPSQRKTKNTPRSVSTQDIKIYDSPSAKMNRKKLSSPEMCFIYEEHTDVVFTDHLELYEPVSLCLMSRLPLLETLQACLKGLYITWVSCDLKSSVVIETLVAELLTNMPIPAINCLPISKPFGALTKLVLHPIHEECSLPYTCDSTVSLLRSIGVHQTLQLLAAVLSDISVLFISSSYTALTSANRAISAIIHPLTISHSLVPIIPADLLEYVQLPSTYIMGIHSSLRDKVDGDLIDVVEIFLDNGKMVIPETVILPQLSSDILELVQSALARILDPLIGYHDLVFTQLEFSRGKSDEELDREVRAVFLCLFLLLFGDYQHYVTVIRFNPSPAFFFNKEAFLTAKPGGDDKEGLVYKMTDSISFYNFCHERSVPFRVCDFFDDLVARFASSPEDFNPVKIFSTHHILEIAEELLHLLPLCTTSKTTYNLEGVDREALKSPVKSFPTLKESVIKAAFADKQKKSDDEKQTDNDLMGQRKIPLLESTPTHKRHTASYYRDLDSLRSCLDALFQSKIIEARKYVPSVTQTLKSGILAEVLVPELVHRFLDFGALLSSDQFDLVVKLLNSALVDEGSAMLLLPLTTIIYREINPGVQQYACTCLQNHCIWSKLEFWRNALYLAIQAELVRIYAEVEIQEHKARRASEAAAQTNDDYFDDERDGSPEPIEVGEITLKSRQRVRSASPKRLRATLRATQRLILSKSARIRMRASVVVPGVSEGVLPPNAEPVTAQEALHHLSKMLALWPSLSEERQKLLMRQEENAVMNQLILFVQRIINLRIPVEFSGGEEEQQAFVEELEEFIGRLLKMVELELNFDLLKHGKIRDQVDDMIAIHLGSLTELRKELKRLPISKPKVIKPPLLSGEVLLLEQGVQAYLLQDGRENGKLLPAHGHVFLTSYRIIFLGTACNPQAPNVIVIRSIPVSSIFRLKKMPPTQISQLSITTVSGLQMRSTTAELIKLGFDEETSQMDMKNLLQHIIDLRYPSKITRGLRSVSPQSPDPALSSLYVGKEINPTEGLPVSFPRQISRRTKNKNETKSKGGNNDVLGSADTLTRVKLLSDISQSPYCQEYDRLELGSVTFSSAKPAQWRTTTINMPYTVCSSYPAVLVVPTKVEDKSLPTVAAQFRHNRFPVVTWKHPNRQAVLIRSSSFNPQPGATKGVITNLINVNAAKQAAKQAAINADALAQNGTSGVGVYNSDVKNYLYHFLHVDKDKRSTSDLLRQISVPPQMMQFEKYMSLKRVSQSSSESIDSGDAIASSQPHRTRSATMDALKSGVGKMMNRVTGFVTRRDSPASGRRFSTSKKGVSSPQLVARRANLDFSNSYGVGQTSEPLKEESKEEIEETSDEKQPAPLAPRSADSSPKIQQKLSPLRLGHKRVRSSGQINDLPDIDLADIVMTEKPRSSTSPDGPLSPIDWEAIGNDRTDDKEVQAHPPPRPSTSTPEDADDDGGSSPELPQRKSVKMHYTWDHFQDSSDKKLKSADISHSSISPGTFSSLPTNPRDWMVVEALPERIREWQVNALYIIGDKSVLQHVPEDLYSNCTFVPVEVPSPSDVNNSFKKLMRACAPSSSQASESAFMADIDYSGWISQLSSIMQLAGAVADLIDVQGSSVMVCLENGWDATAQVVSLAQILLDPHYRTLAGFKTLIEKDWLSFGHSFSQKGHHTASSDITDFSPIFLQFLDAVHQIVHQFPLSFEFNDFYLRMLAYHHSSMRFHTFTLDTEKERYASNWLPYRPRLAHLHGNTGQMEEYVSIWDHIDKLHRESMLFYNFKYQPKEDPEPLRPYSYQANLDVWCFYLDNFISQFPPYDTELISEGPLTLLDMHHNLFERERYLGVPIEPAGSAMNELCLLLRQYTGLMNSMAPRLNILQATWMELWDDLQDSTDFSEPPSPLFPADNMIVSHGQTLHKRTTLAVLIKGKLASELEEQLTHPHDFEVTEVNLTHQECGFCKHQLMQSDETNVYKCKMCGCVCHGHCKGRMPYNCGQKTLPLTKPKKVAIKDLHDYPDYGALVRRPSSTFYLTKSGRETQLSEGFLYKRGKVVKNWKRRWFILDTKKKELSYYDSKQDSKCHGTIQISDIHQVHEAEPQIVPLLKPGKQGFFFNLVTPKRVYYLMAVNEFDRTSWIRAIKAAIAVVL